MKAGTNTYDTKIKRGDDTQHQHHQCTMGSSVNAGRRGDPHAIYQTRNEAIYHSKKEATYQSRKEAVHQTCQQAIYQSRKEASYHTRQKALYQSRQEATRQQQHREPIYQTRQEAASGGLGSVQNIYETIDNDRSNEKRRLSKPELRKFSREPTVLKVV